MTMLAAIVLGTGLPTTPSYILLTALLIPAIMKLGVIEPAAHMFAFYYAVLSAITPPVALAVFAAAGLAKADMWESGWAAMKIGAAGFIIPFMFVYQPALLMIGDWPTIIVGFITSCVGIALFAGGLHGYFVTAASYWQRALLVGRRHVAWCSPACGPISQAQRSPAIVIVDPAHRAAASRRDRQASPSAMSTQTPRGPAQPSLARRQRPALVRPPLAPAPVRLRRDRLGRQAGDRHHQHLERDQRLPRASALARRGREARRAAGRRLSGRAAGDVARRAVREADHHALSQFPGDGDRGAAAQPSDRRRGADGRLRQDHARR